MSFSSDVKGELARIENKKKCCMLAEIAGFLRVSSSIRLAGGGKLGIVATTENAATARHFKKLIKGYFKSNAGLAVGDSQMPGSRKGRNRYYLNISPDEKSMHILRETGMMLIREGDDYFSDGIYQPIIKSKCCRKAYLRGMFLSCGTMSDPNKGYHLEFVLDKEQTANDLRKLIGTFVDLSANMTTRGDKYIVYIKKQEYIRDILSLMGADGAVLDFEEIRIMRSSAAKTRKIMNFEDANGDRSLKAAEEQKGWLRKIAESECGREASIEELTDPSSDFWSEGLRHLPAPLKEVAYIRLYKPDADLRDIGETLSPPIGKPAVSKRFAKLKAIAEEM
jgi:DNA-binding protein WhiA